MTSRYFEGAKHALDYAKFRPTPCPALISSIINFLNTKLPSEKHDCCIDVGCGSGQSTHCLAPHCFLPSEKHDCCIDVGCGSGQSTHCLAPHFKRVVGVDVSPAQIQIAQDAQKPSNVTYQVCEAEKLPVEAGSVQLVNSCQACHWFNLPAFFAEADRVLVPGGVVALHGYKLPEFVNHPDKDKAQSILMQFYEGELAGCWAKERFEVDEGYTDDRFRIPYPDFFRQDGFGEPRTVRLQDVAGLLRSWSGY
ncbi:putative methyltransferase DDB_G0268948, partial [Hyalella azteca]|uniref:Methyltransferase DDB_G0268948 n=1 Tax=Hyalella azteca TaxID=294128 RepID=A0A8B7N4I4_HYAAZ